MKSKILIGSILVLTLLLLMPSIPAIQKNRIDERIKQDLQEKLDEIDLKEIKKLSENGNWPYPILELIGWILIFRALRGFYMAVLSGTSLINRPYKNPIFFTILMLRGMWLFATADLLLDIINSITHPNGQVKRI